MFVEAHTGEDDMEYGDIDVECIDCEEIEIEKFSDNLPILA